MDSISQFVLGAAVGEAVLGKSMKNKALLWGGIAGTIPDLDVIFSPVMSEVDSLAFHRGISHSISFAVLGALLFGWLLFKLYNRRNGEGINAPPTLNKWRWMFFLAFLTHSLLDCFTMYGTQLFAPFSDYRVAFSTVSVADPLYTVPFLISLVVVAFYNSPKKRALWNYIGIAWSCLYLCFTIVNKQFVSDKYEAQLAKQGIEYQRYILGPTILNNILWSATVETDSFYLQGQYSLFDKSDIIFNRIDKHHNLLENKSYDRTTSILKWFTDGYFNIITRSDGHLQFNDLRYGTFRGTGDGENDYIFRFVLDRAPDGAYIVKETKGGPEPGDEKLLMKRLIDRIKGI